MKSVLFLVILLSVCFQGWAQLKMGTAKSEINFREGPGVNYRVSFKIDNSNLLVILPRETKNNFIEVFDIESSSYGFVAENLITITDTLNFQKQHFFEFSNENSLAKVEIELVNHTTNNLFFWINKIVYNLAPYEKKVLVMTDEEIMFFSSASGLYPVFGKEVLKKGNTYRFDFNL